MSKIDNFKKFMSNHPEYIDYLKNNKLTWQSFYELYDIYGEDESIWKKYVSEEVKETFSLKNILNTIKKIDLTSLEENISSIQKAVSLVEEFTKEEKKEEKKSVKEEKIEKLYGDE